MRTFRQNSATARSEKLKYKNIYGKLSTMKTLSPSQIQCGRMSKCGKMRNILIKYTQIYCIIPVIFPRTLYGIHLGQYSGQTGKAQC